MFPNINKKEVLDSGWGCKDDANKNGKLSANKIKLLEAIGFEWNPQKVSWDRRYEELKVFKASNNHCNVPLAYQQNKYLGQWVGVQRGGYKNGKLSANKIKLLEAIGFEWKRK